MFHKDGHFSPKRVKKRLLMHYLQCASPFVPSPAMLLKHNFWSWRQDTWFLQDPSFLQAAMRQSMMLFAVCIGFPLSKTQTEFGVPAKKKNLNCGNGYRTQPSAAYVELHPEAKVISFGSKHTPRTEYCPLKGTVVLSLMGSLSSHQFVNKKVIC